MAFNGTPLIVDQYSRYLANYFDEKDYIFEPTLAQSFYGRPENGGQTIFSQSALDVDIDISRANERIAAIAPRGTVTKFVGSYHADGQIGQMTTISRKFLLVEEELNLGAHQLFARVGGEGPYENKSTQERMRIQAARGYKELIRRIVRLQEVLAWQGLRLGVQSAQNIADTTVNIYDFRRNAANTPALTHGWGNAAGVPLTDLDALADQLLAVGHVMPNFAIFGGTTMRYFLANQQVSTNYANKLYFELIRFGLDEAPGNDFQRLINAGAVPFGRLKTPKGYELTIFTYPRMYMNAAGVATTKYLADTDLIMGSTMTRCDRYFGPPERLEPTSVDIQRRMERYGFNPNVPPMPLGIMDPGNVVIPQSFYVDDYESTDHKSTTLRVQAAPIFAPNMTDAWGAMVPGVAT
jgi:hypothetical protein